RCVEIATRSLQLPSIPPSPPALKATCRMRKCRLFAVNDHFPGTFSAREPASTSIALPGRAPELVTLARTKSVRLGLHAGEGRGSPPPPPPPSRPVAHEARAGRGPM